ncbi:hypothetical protein [Amycolatopsis kentuckyensis]|uniref:hypothetical protein n=1 Tax=Amycolatopsis kentuckyensis TaxID=218823 RepID=UPI00356AE0D6
MAKQVVGSLERHSGHHEVVGAARLQEQGDFVDAAAGQYDREELARPVPTIALQEFAEGRRFRLPAEVAIAGAVPVTHPTVTL